MRTTFAAALLLLATAAAHAASANLVVRVLSSTSTPVVGAQVVALYFQNGNPSAAATRVAYADASGNATFSGTSLLVAGDAYQVVVASQGYLPGLVDQFNSGPISLTAGAASATPPTFTVSLSSVGVGAGEIDLNFVNATPSSLVFGQASLTGGGGALAYAVAVSSQDGTGVLRAYDVPYGAANAYRISAFEPTLNRSQSFGVGTALNGGAPLVAAGSLPTADFSVAPPPASVVNNSQSSAGGLSADIVVTGPSHEPVPYIGVAVGGAYLDAYNQWHYDQRGGGTDQTGHVQLYSLIPGVTYYTSVFGNCWNGTCYQGSQSTAIAHGFGTAPGTNDFLYKSSVTVLGVPIALSTMPAGTGQLAVYVTDQFGTPFPWAGISINPDWSNWQTAGGATCGGASASNPGLTNLNTNATTGYALLTGLQSGNYQLSAYTQYGPVSFNGFDYASGSQFGLCSSSSTQVRLSIDTTTTPDARTYDSFGNLLTNASSETIVVRVSTSGTGLVSGTLTFPSSVDLSQSPIVIALQPQCNGGGSCSSTGGGFRSYASASTGPVIDYAVPVSSGQSYYMTFTSKYWGAITAGGSELTVDLHASSAAWVPVTFAPAGRVAGSLRKPDGSVFLPQSGQYIWVAANGNNSWGNGQLAADGSFTIGGLLPGVYTFMVGSSGGDSNSFPYTAKQPAQTITISANADTLQDANLDNAVSIKPFIAVSSLPALNIVTQCPPNSDCPAETWAVYALAAGTPLSAQTMTDMLVHGGGGGQSGADGVAGEFDYSASTGQVNGCAGGFLAQPGFCVTPIPAKPGAGSSYDFYLARKGGFDSAGLAGGARPNLVIFGSTSNVIVSAARATDPIFQSFGGPSGSTTTAQDIVVNPPANLSGMPQAVLFGTFTMTNMITPLQFSQLGGKFDNFLHYLPIVYLYDSSGVFRASGIGVPYPPAERPFENQLKQSVAGSNYSAFKSLTAVSGWGPIGYEIRGLTAGTTYNLVATSPNYPPFKTTVVLAAAQSTTTVNVNFDANPGSTLFGVVETTNSTPVPNAQVTVSASGYGPTTLTTDSGGNWSITGLSAGQYTVTAFAAGFVQQAAGVSVAANSSVGAPNLVMSAANASIAGSVYTNNPICPAGATGCAAFGRTALVGASVVAYDDTLNASNPAAVLPLYRAVTDSSGAYKLSGLSAGEAYKVFVNAPGYYVLNQSTLAASGGQTGFDFALKPKPLQVNVYGHPNGANYEFKITNFLSFSSGTAWIGASPFTKATSTDVSKSFFQQPDSQGVTQLLLDYPLASLTTGVVYVMHLEAQPNDPRAALVVTDVQFGLNLPHNTCQAIDQALLGDDGSTNAQGLPLNSVPLDISGGTGGNATAISIPAGSLLPIFSTAVPSACMTETDASVAPEAQAPGVSTGAFASGVYSVSMTSANPTAKGVDLTLSYNQNGSDIKDLAVFSYDSTTQKWNSVPGVQTLDPVKGTIKVKGLKSLASVLSLHGPTGLMAVADRSGYRPTGLAIPNNGSFAVMRPSQVSGGAFSGTVVKIYNFPNPFSLETKSVNLSASAVCTGGAPTVVTDGTVIKYEIPAGISGQGVIRIYTLSGRLVREVDAGPISPSSCYYTTWDGKNRNGQPVANGVYYGVLSVGGTKQSSGTFKLAVIK